jgi:hypothetical protein
MKIRKAGFASGSPVAALLLAGLLPHAVSTTWAQSDPDAMSGQIEVERQRLNEHMRVLQQQMLEIQRQADRLDAMERQLAKDNAAEESAPAIVSAPAPTASEATAPVPDEAADVAPERVANEPNQTRGANVMMTSGDLVAEDFPGSWPMFGTDYRMKFGGYFKLDALYDFDGTGDEYQFLISQIPVEGTPEADRAGYFNMFVRETRFNFDIRNSPSDQPAQQFFLEMDFFDESSFSPRLRQAYIVYGNVLIGQTWSTTTDLNSLPFIIDFGAGDALFGTRTPQIRWQQELDPSWSWAVGLEMLQSSGIYNPLGLLGEASPQLPVLAARLSHQHSDGERSLSALVQQLRWDSFDSGPNPTAAGWALIFAGRQNFSERSFFTWNLAYGDGTPENIMALTGSDANAVLTDDYRLVTRKGYSAALGLGYNWSSTLSSNLAYAWTDLEDLGADERAPDAIESGGVAHVNLIWALSGTLSTGIEYMWGNRQDVDGGSGEASRVQGMFKYTY